MIASSQAPGQSASTASARRCSALMASPPFRAGQALRAACSRQFGRASAPMMSQLVHTVRGPNVGCGPARGPGASDGVPECSGSGRALLGGLELWQGLGVPARHQLPVTAAEPGGLPTAPPDAVSWRGHLCLCHHRAILSARGRTLGDLFCRLLPAWLPDAFF
jgi:hypothetical protein